jgi:hypothetical protein
VSAFHARERHTYLGIQRDLIQTVLCSINALILKQATNEKAVLYIQRVPVLAEADWGEWRMFLWLTRGEL